jgi:DNA-binding CsgD family transcriptional regulator
MRLISDGLTPKEIAVHLHLSTHTVKQHMRNASNKLGARNGKHAVALFLETT